MNDLNDDAFERIDITKIPQPDRSDAALAGTKAIISAIPWVGGPCVEIINYLVTPSIIKRKDKLTQEIGTQLVELQQKGIVDLNSLVNNEAFVTVLLHALQIGLRNHREEKLEAIKNIVLNSAIALDPEDELNIHFLNLIDSMTALHLVLFIYSNDPRAWIEKNPSISERLAIKNADQHSQVPIQWIFPELRGQEEFVNTIFTELRDMNLIITQPCYDMIDTGDSNFPPTSALGRQFLTCISPPVRLEE